MTRPWSLCLFLPLVLLLGLFRSPALASEQGYALLQQGLELERELSIYPAREYLRRAVRADPQNGGYLQALGWFLSKYGFSQEAVQVFSRALPLSENPRPLYLGIGWNQRRLGRLEEAFSAYRKVYDLPPAGTEPGVIIDRVTAELAKENAVRIAELEKEIAQAAEDEKLPLRKELFGTLVHQQEFDRAIALGRDLLPSLEEDWVWRLEFARVLFWAGQLEEAAKALERLIELAPPSAYLHFLLGRVEAARGDLVRARHLLERSVGIHPGDARVRKELAEVLALQGEEGEALAQVEVLVGQTNDSLYPRLARARILHFSGRLEQAIPLYRDILRDFPNHGEALWGLAECLIYTGRPFLAQQVLDEWKDPDVQRDPAAARELLAHALEPNLAVGWEYYRNTSNFSRINSGASAQAHLRPGVGLKTEYYFSHFQQESFRDFKRHSLGFQADWQVSPDIGLGGRLAFNLYDRGQERVNGRVSLSMELSPSILAKFSLERIDLIDTELPFENPIYNPVVTIGAVGRRLYSDEGSLFIRGKITPRLDLVGEIIRGEFSDGNRKLSYLLEANLRPIYDPRFQTGYTYYFLDLRDPAPLYVEDGEAVTAYFDPRNFEVHTVYLRVRDTWQPMTAGLEYRLSYLPKSDGLAHSIFSFVNWKFATDHSLRLDGRLFLQDEGVDREGESGFFRAENITLTYRLQF